MHRYDPARQRLALGLAALAAWRSPLLAASVAAGLVLTLWIAALRIKPAPR